LGVFSIPPDAQLAGFITAKESQPVFEIHTGSSRMLKKYS